MSRPERSSWGYAPWLPAIGAAALAGGLVWALLSYPGRDRTVAIAIAVFGLVALVCTLRLRTRLTVDDAGIVVRSLLGSRRVDWADITAVTAVPHRRLGTTSRLLEIDLADDSLLAFSSVELGTDCEIVAGTLAARRAAAR
ncbi:PH domain-containing protein [Nakamurella lactea]|uniref:PH domain-containing protein n=1 Tax=Nakamurella lactea TaxID=459515 RepID=UPI00041FC0AC|nr:PH domain-containing protein [Nakamurella lactea]